MNHFILIGISDNYSPEFSQRVKQVIGNHKIFSGGKRHYQIVKEFLPPDHQWLDITVPLGIVLDKYRRIDDEVVVFASGDPLFYGFANTLQREFPGCTMEVFSYFNSLQMLAQKCAYPYQYMVNTSVTGRPWKELDKALIEARQMIGVLTDKRKTPDHVARHLLEYGYTNYNMTIGEALGGPQEKILTMSLEEAAKSQFNTLSCLILHMTQPRKLSFGLEEGDFHHLKGRPNMITKRPVRLFSLSLLDLSNRKTFWDVGFCTGSVSIEARLTFPHLTICSFEKREESSMLFDMNTQKFGAPGIQKFIGDFMKQKVNALPRPDSVFIGGHGGQLSEMISLIDSVLLPQGVIVINCVTSKSQQQFLDSCHELGYKITSQNTLCIDNHNPITLLAAQKRDTTN